jgi:WhiB family transcriptional regulator, redox-sensing transcriptional regulator
VITETLQLITSHTPKWMRRALCADADPSLFFPEPGEENTPRIREAISICNHCPVKVLCLNWAFDTEDRFAILGGKTANQRSRLRRASVRQHRITRRMSQTA